MKPGTGTGLSDPKPTGPSSYYLRGSGTNTNTNAVESGPGSNSSPEPGSDRDALAQTQTPVWAPVSAQLDDRRGPTESSPLLGPLRGSGGSSDDDDDDDSDSDSADLHAYSHFLGFGSTGTNGSATTTKSQRGEGGRRGWWSFWRNVRPKRVGGEENGGGGWGWVGQRVSAVRKSVFSRKVMRDVGESAVRSLPAVLLGMLLNILDGVSCEYQSTAI